MPVAESTYTEIGAFDAKTKLSEILRKVEQGERFTITLRGRPVANLVPGAGSFGGQDCRGCRGPAQLSQG